MASNTEDENKGVCALVGTTQSIATRICAVVEKSIEEAMDDEADKKALAGTIISVATKAAGLSKTDLLMVAMLQNEN